MDAAAVLVTKIEPPRLRPGHVSRGRLLAHLAGTEQPRLTLLVAPAGAGKSTLLAEWHASLGGDAGFAWLGLDEADNDPVRFWTHAAASLRRAGATLPAGIADGLAAPGVRAGDVILPRLVNALAVSPRELILALDDYHLITRAEIHEGISFLLQHLPAAVRLAIASRTRPPLGVARLRAGGQLADVSAEALRFSHGEAAQLLNGTLALALAERDLDVLRTRTEGWAAGLYLAGLTLRESSDRTAAIAAFTGSERHIVDYLAEEVLAGLDAETRGFLLETSILDRMTAALCDATRAAAGSAGLLERLEHSNLFLVPLDSEGRWFRYHALFQAMLQRRLAAERGAGDVAALHGRAAAWLADTGDADAAISHWLAAGRPASAAALVARDWNAELQSGRLATALRWLDALPAELVEGDPQLCLARAWTFFDAGEFALVERWAAAAEAADDGRELREGGRSVAGAVAMLRATLAFALGDLGRAAELSARAVELEPGAGSPWRAVALATLGSATYLTGGDASTAIEALEEAVSLARPGVNSLATLRSLGMLALIALELGRMSEAERWVARADELRARASLDGYPTGSWALSAKAQLLAAAGDLEPALALLAQARLIAARGGVRPYLLHLLTVMIPLTATASGEPAARDLLQEARAVAEACSDPALLGHALDDAERRLGGRAQTGRRGPDELSERERAVLRLLPTRLTFAEIGAELYVSKNTVRTHAQSIYRKLGAESRGEAVAAARRHALL